MVGRDASYDAAFGEIMIALAEAERYHPEWPKDGLHRAAIVVEEAGEVLQAALNMKEFLATHKPSCDWDEHTDNSWMRYHHDLKLELAQTGAMALRHLASLISEEG